MAPSATALSKVFIGRQRRPTATPNEHRRSSSKTAIASSCRGSNGDRERRISALGSRPCASIVPPARLPPVPLPNRRQTPDEQATLVRIWGSVLLIVRVGEGCRP